MQTLASILAGLPTDPTQVSQGLSPLLMQQLLSQGGMMGQAGLMAQGQAGQPPQTQLGNLGAVALPQMLAGY